jgi:ABC-type transporter MlaC component
VFVQKTSGIPRNRGVSQRKFCGIYISDGRSPGKHFVEDGASISYNNRKVSVEVFVYKFRKLCFCCALGIFFSAGNVFPHKAATENENKDYRSFVQNLGNDAISIINTPEISRDEIIKKFGNIVEANFSVNQMAKFAVGRHAKSLKDGEKNEFLKNFTKMLIKLYASNFEEYKTAKFTVIGQRRKSENQFIVESKVVIPGKPEVMIAWHVSKNEGKFLITDAVTNEVSIRLILQEQISGIISEKGLQKFLIEFAEKYEEL